MAASKVIHGARAILSVSGKKVGFFANCSWNVNLDVAPVYIIGRLSAAELVYTGAEVVSVTAAGFRIMDQGAFGSTSGVQLIPKLTEMLTYEDISIELTDRSAADPAKATIMKVSNCKATGFSSQVSPRSLQEFTVTFQGLVYTDETADTNEEPTDSMDLAVHASGG
jgi:hypothetical protein